MEPTINLYHGDCMEAMRAMKDKAYDLAIVDPPYGIGMDNSNKRTKPDRPNSYTNYKEFRYKDSDWDIEPPTSEYFIELLRVSKNQIVWGANYFNHVLPNGYGWIFWNKLNGLDNCFSDGEFAFSSKGVQSRYFECSAFNNLNGGKDRIHPTQKPVKLYKWLLKNYAKPGDKILDTHGGSMSIAIACFDMGFDLDLWEIDKDYYEAGVRRFNDHKKQLKLFRA
jgi:site-specific DNA-methyltransferase (adenine-specific)